MNAYLVAHLKDDVALAALVGTRIWTGVMPQGSTLPAIVFQQTSRAPVRSRHSPDAIARTRWQFSVNARTYQTVRSVTDELVRALQTFSRNGTPYVSHVAVDTVTDDIQPGYDTSDYFRTLVYAYIHATDGTGASPRATVYAGDTLQFLVTILDVDSVPIELAGATATYVLSLTPSSAALVTKSSTVSGQINLLVDGVAEINLIPGDTDDFEQGTYYHELEVVTADAETITGLAEYINFRETVV